MVYFFFFSLYDDNLVLHSFPTRRSSDLTVCHRGATEKELAHTDNELKRSSRWLEPVLPRQGADRKSTRLNSSHLGISYAVFCLKKKKTIALKRRFNWRGTSICMRRVNCA